MHTNNNRFAVKNALSKIYSSGPARYLSLSMSAEEGTAVGAVMVGVLTGVSAVRTQGAGPEQEKQQQGHKVSLGVGLVLHASGDICVTRGANGASRDGPV